MIIYKNYVIMQRSLFFTTMVNHQPVLYSVRGGSSLSSSETTNQNKDETNHASRQFHLTSVRDPNNPNPNIPGHPALRQMLTRSTQPIFSVSAMFGVRTGGGCGACGH